MKKILAFSVLMAIGILNVPLASGDVVTYTNEGNFLAAAGNTLFESFESQANTAFSNNPIVGPYFSLDPTVAPARIRSTNTGGHFATHGVKYIEAGDSALSITLVFNLNQPTRGFGLFVTDFGDQLPSSLVMTGNAGESINGFVIQTVPPLLDNGNLIFFGFIQDTPFTQIVLTTSAANDGIGIDSVHLMAVPEPGAGLSIVSLATFVFWKRSRRS